jgi:hypothetical protein
VAFLDGHVETRAYDTHLEVPGNNFISPEQAMLMEQRRLGFVSDGDLSGQANPDELYDQF